MADSQNTTGTEPLKNKGGQGFPADNPRTGEPGLIGRDDFTKEYEIARINRGHVEVLAGNFADLQRLGAQAATGGNINVKDAVATGPGVDPSADNVVTPAQHDAMKGEWTVESERAGLIDAPAEHVPAENKEPNSIDPGSESPTPQPKSGQASAPKSPSK